MPWTAWPSTFQKAQHATCFFFSSSLTYTCSHTYVFICRMRDNKRNTDGTSNLYWHFIPLSDLPASLLVTRKFFPSIYPCTFSTGDNVSLLQILQQKVRNSTNKVKQRQQMYQLPNTAQANTWFNFLFLDRHDNAEWLKLKNSNHLMTKISIITLSQPLLTTAPSDGAITAFTP